ncbi:hypothetical protein FIU97_02405 [Roseivivax sp. THAF40]|nr:hypothetical protein FIU97_02405 [Roseivivax sp. THAF40]
MIATRFNGNKANLHLSRFIKLDTIKSERSNFEPLYNDFVNPNRAKKIRSDEREFLASISLDLKLVVCAGLQGPWLVCQGHTRR